MFFCRRGMIRNSGDADDEKKDTVWIVGIYTSLNKKDLYEQCVENRKNKTIERFLERRIGVGKYLQVTNSLDIRVLHLDWHSYTSLLSILISLNITMVCR